MPIQLSRDVARLALLEGQTHACRLHAPVRVRVRCGLVWLTVEEGGADVWLRAGQEFDFHGRGLAVFEAVRDCAELEILPLPGRWARLGRALAAGLRQPAASACDAGRPDAAARITHLLPRGLIRWF